MSSAAEEPRTEREAAQHLAAGARARGVPPASLHASTRRRRRSRSLHAHLGRSGLGQGAAAGVARARGDRRLAEWLDDRGAGKALDTPNVVCYQRSGSLPPFFCVAPVAGQVLCYKQLAEELGPEQPFTRSELWAERRRDANDNDRGDGERAAGAGCCDYRALSTAPGEVPPRRMVNGRCRRVRDVPAAFAPCGVGGRRLEAASSCSSTRAPFGQMPTFSVPRCSPFAADLTSCRASFDHPPPTRSPLPLTRAIACSSSSSTCSSRDTRAHLPSLLRESACPQRISAGSGAGCSGAEPTPGEGKRHQCPPPTIPRPRRY